jgi:hypothetical protein
MRPLEQLFALEVEFFPRLRTDAPGTMDTSSPHTSYALRFGYERLIGAVGIVTGRDIDALKEQLALAGDPRDVLNARDSLMKILGIDWKEANHAT